MTLVGEMILISLRHWCNCHSKVMLSDHFITVSVVRPESESYSHELCQCCSSAAWRRTLRTETQTLTRWKLRKYQTVSGDTSRLWRKGSLRRMRHLSQSALRVSRFFIIAQIPAGIGPEAWTSECTVDVVPSFIHSLSYLLCIQQHPTSFTVMKIMWVSF